MSNRLHRATFPSRRPAGCRYAMRAFTLFELMVVLSIAAILATLAVPAMRNFLQSQQSLSASSQIMSSLNYARSEAIKEDLNVTAAIGVRICASSNELTCDPAGNWNNGWIVLSSMSATPLAAYGALQTGLTLTTVPATPEVDFQPNGMTTLAALVEFKLCDSRGATYARDVEIDLTGRIQAASKVGYDVTGTTALVCP
ncbi:MAG: GspH/FimT family pseudopilin [Steroidobacteraceae bacterium]